ncbi:MAG: hypothetical protein ACRDT6_08665 [Micromonosporaceae bacterium]
MTEPTAPPLEPFVEPVPCGTCGGPIVNSVLGWLHVTEHGVPATGWLCPVPHMHLAEPDFLAAPDVSTGRETAPSPPKRMPTPIPPRKDVGRAASSPQAAPPAQWPPLQDGEWWQPQ